MFITAANQSVPRRTAETHHTLLGTSTLPLSSAGCWASPEPYSFTRTSAVCLAAASREFHLEKVGSSAPAVSFTSWTVHMMPPSLPLAEAMVLPMVLIVLEFYAPKSI